MVAGSSWTVTAMIVHSLQPKLLATPITDPPKYKIHSYKIVLSNFEIQVVFSLNLLPFSACTKKSLRSERPNTGPKQ